MSLSDRSFIRKAVQLTAAAHAHLQDERTKLLDEYAQSSREVSEAESKLKMMHGLDPDRVGRLERLVKDLQTLAMHYTGERLFGRRADFGQEGLLTIWPRRKRQRRCELAAERADDGRGRREEGVRNS